MPGFGAKGDFLYHIVKEKAVKLTMSTHSEIVFK